MARGKWWPGDMPSQRDKMQNFKAKIGLYQTELGLSPAEVDAAQLLCDAFIDAYNFSEACEYTSKAVTSWRNSVFRGEPTGGPIPDPPVFPVGAPSVGTLGVVTQFFELREQLVVASGFTDAIGDDLGILGAEIGEEPEEEIAPSLKVTAASGFKVAISGSMQGNSQIRIEYRKAGETNWTLVTYLSNLPAEVPVVPTTPGVPEKGDIRAIFYRKNEEYGVHSPNYPVTLS